MDFQFKNNIFLFFWFFLIGELILSAQAEVPVDEARRKERWYQDLQEELAYKKELEELNEEGFFFTFYRNPSTGLEYKQNELGIHLGWFSEDLVNSSGGQNQVMFLKVGIRGYFEPTDWSPFLGMSFLYALDENWDDGFQLEGGYRFSFFRIFDVRAGIGLSAFTKQKPTFGPTVGLGVKIPYL